MIQTRMLDLLEDHVRARVGGERGAGLVLSRLTNAERDCVAELHNGVPPEGGSASRKMLEQVVATAFQSGVFHATKFVEPSEV